MSNESSQRQSSHESCPSGRTNQPGTAEDAIKHLQAYAFSCGFAIVVSTSNTEKKRYKFSHHLKEPRNNWKLEANVASREDYEKAGGLSANGSKKLRRRAGKTRGKRLRL